MNRISNIKLPEYNPYIQKPHNSACKIIDSTRLMIEILWWINTSSYELSLSKWWEKILLDWKYSFLVRYKRESDETYHPSLVFSFNIDEKGNINIRQIQWTKQSKVAYRCNSSFDYINYFTEMIEDNFSKRWIYVYINKYQSWLDNAWNAEKAILRYDRLANNIWHTKK